MPRYHWTTPHLTTSQYVQILLHTITTRNQHKHQYDTAKQRAGPAVHNQSAIPNQPKGTPK
jgi:hypothetical protein